MRSWAGPEVTTHTAREINMQSHVNSLSWLQVGLGAEPCGLHVRGASTFKKAYCRPTVGWRGGMRCVDWSKMYFPISREQVKSRQLVS